MASLDDYISGLVASVARARYSADLQAAEVARLYKNDDVLRCFAVPHMRIDDIEIDLPYALDTQTALQESYSINGSLMCQKIEQAFYRSYDRFENPSEINQEVVSVISSFVEDKTPRMEDDGLAYLETLEFQSELLNTVETLCDFCFGEVCSKEENQIAAENITETIRSAITVTTAGGVQVIAEASQLQSCDSKAITHVKIKIHEDGMVWTGKTGQETLIPE